MTIIQPTPPRRLVQTLRKQKIKVSILHYRWARRILRGLVTVSDRVPSLTLITRLNRRDYHIESNGGETHVALLFPNGRETGGMAVCSREDTYNKRLGVYIATQRATAMAKDAANMESPK